MQPYIGLGLLFLENFAADLSLGYKIFLGLVALRKPRGHYQIPLRRVSEGSERSIDMVGCKGTASEATLV